METAQVLVNPNTNKTSGQSGTARGQSDSGKDGSADKSVAEQFLTIFNNLMSSTNSNAMVGQMSSMDDLPDVSIAPFEVKAEVEAENQEQQVQTEERELDTTTEEDEEEVATEDETQVKTKETEQVVKEVVVVAQEEQIAVEILANTQKVATPVVEEDSAEVASVATFEIAKQLASTEQASDKKAVAEAPANGYETPLQSQQQTVATKPDAQEQALLKTTEAIRNENTIKTQAVQAEQTSSSSFVVDKGFSAVQPTLNKSEVVQTSIDVNKQIPNQDVTNLIRNAVESAFAKQGTGNSTGNTFVNTQHSYIAVDDVKKGGILKGSEFLKTANNLPQSHQDKAIETIQKMMETAVQNRQGTTMVVRLDPPELGGVTVKMVHRGDQLYARLIPENSDVEATLKSRVQEIISSLVSSGIKQENINVSIGSDVSSQQSQQSPFAAMSDRSNSESGSEWSGSKSGFGHGENQASVPLSGQVPVSNNSEQAGWVA